VNTLRVERRRGGPARILPRTLMDSWRNAPSASAARATADLKPAGEGLHLPPTAAAVGTLNTRARIDVSPRRCASVVVRSGDCRRNVHPVRPPRDLGTGGWRVAPTRVDDPERRCDAPVRSRGIFRCRTPESRDECSRTRKRDERGSSTPAGSAAAPIRTTTIDPCARHLRPAPKTVTLPTEFADSRHACTSAPHQLPSVRRSDHPRPTCTVRLLSAQSPSTPPPSPAILDGQTCVPHHDDFCMPCIPHPRAASDSPDAERRRVARLSSLISSPHLSPTRTRMRACTPTTPVWSTPRILGLSTSGRTEIARLSRFNMHATP
jgi:hypothetical protein